MTYRDRDRVIRWLEAGNGEKLTLLDRGILRDIAEAANTETGLAWLGETTLSARWGVTTRAVQLSIARLHRHGLLTTVESGRWHRRARYTLAGELDRVTDGSPYSPNEGSGYESATARTTVRYSPNDGSLQPEPSFANSPNDGSGVYRSHHGIKRSDDDSDERQDDSAGAPSPAAMDGQDLPAGVDNDLVDQVADTLKIPTGEAKRWIADTLNGRQIRTSIPAYIRACMKNYRPPKPKPAPTGNGATPTEPMSTCCSCGLPIKRGQEIPASTFFDVNPSAVICRGCLFDQVIPKCKRCRRPLPGFQDTSGDPQQIQRTIDEAWEFIANNIHGTPGDYYHPECCPEQDHSECIDDEEPTP